MDEEKPAYSVVHRQALERFAPPSLLIDAEDQVAHMAENLDHYLVHPGGKPTGDVAKLLRTELRVELRAALHLVRQTQRKYRSAPIELRSHGSAFVAMIEAVPAGSGFVLVMFHEGSVRGTERTAVDAACDAESSESSEQAELANGEVLQTKLDRANVLLQATIDDYETSQEEMEAANEELQSANEKLQSKNVELQTVNQENRHQVDELSRLSSDLQNHLATTDIATIFLDREFRILRFTPRVAELFNVRAADRGRPLADLTHRLIHDKLLADAGEVLKTLAPVEFEVRDDVGRWYMARILPCRSVDDRIDGIVLTFVEITKRRLVETALQSSEERFRRLVEMSALIVWSTNATGAVDDSPSWRSFTGQSIDAWLANRWTEVIHPEDGEWVTRAWMDCVETETPLDIEFRLYHAQSATHRWVNVRGVPLRDAVGAVVGWIGMNLDIEDHKQIEASLQRFNETLEQQVVERTREARGHEARARKMAKRLSMAEQEERRRIAGVLHDDLQQLLYGMEMRLGMIRADLDERGETDAVAGLASVQEIMSRALSSTRRLTVELSPRILRGEGLVAALEWLLRQMQEMHQLQVKLEATNFVDRLSVDMRALVFQTVRELLFNVRKHAEIDTAKIILSAEDNCLKVVVQDEGRGFETLELEHSSVHFGLANARERIQLIGGAFEVRSALGSGTSVEIVVPHELEL